MQQKPVKDRVPDTVFRAFFGILALPMFLLSGCGFYFRIIDNWKFPEGSTTPVLDHIGVMISWELHVALFISSALTIIWAVAAPQWVERLWDRASAKALALVFLMVVVSAIYGWLS